MLEGEGSLIDVETHEFIDAFKGLLPSGSSLLVDREDDACVVQASSGGRHSLTLVREKGGPSICKSSVKEEVRFLRSGADDSYKVYEFTAPGELPGGGKARNVAEIWPAPGVCTEGAKCPLVFHLHSVGQKGSDPELLRQWAFLNYYVTDPACHASLRSVVLIPQISEEENAGTQGPALFKQYFVPLLDQFLASNANVDKDRVALVGQSEGAMGALQGSILYPDRFSLLVAGGATAPGFIWPDVPRELSPVNKGAPSKLKVVVLSWASADNPTYDMTEGLKMMQHGGLLEHVTVKGRFYKGVPHMAAAEGLLNHVRAVHEVLWAGKFDQIDDVV